jgi:peptidoglycan/LPS O-acetylase OafA/YrhL
MAHRYLHKSGLYWLCFGASLILLAAHAHPPAPRRGLHWLARMGALSYELYLSHMFIVLGAVALYRALLGKEQAWTVIVYLPVLVLCYALAVVLERISSPRVAAVGTIESPGKTGTAEKASASPVG